MPQTPDIDAIIRQFGGVLEAPGAAPVAERPTDPRTGQPVIVPGEPGYRVPGSPEDLAAHDQAPMGVMGAARNAAYGLVSTLNPINIAKGLYGAAAHPLDTVNAMGSAQAAQGRRVIDLVKRGNFNPMSREGLANLIEVPGRVAAAAIPVIGPAAAGVGESLGATDDPARQARAVGEAVGMIAGPKMAGSVTRRVAPVMRRGAERLAGATLGPVGDDILTMTGAPSRAAARTQLAQTALDEGVVPGVITSGATRSARLMDDLLGQAQTALAGPAGDAAITPARVVGPSVSRVQRSIATQFAPGTERAAASGAVRQIADHPLLVKETARNLNTIAAGNVGKVRGHAGAAYDATRAMGQDARREIARVAPDTAPTLGRIDRLEPVSEAYARMTGNAVDVPGLPTIQARILLAGLNRLVGPAARGLNAGSRVDPAAASRLTRAAILAQLLGQQVDE